ncbi:hypothetical protein HYY70_00590 [Candidatus Woesearchaeota archaeon]|nr:hypothetical protein [Candidatus Woesearchaeota archaeon]
MRIPKKLRKYALWLFIASAYPIYSNEIFATIQDVWPKIKTTEEAIRILNEEKSKLGIEVKVALAMDQEDKFKEINIGAFCGRNEEGYFIGIGKPSLSRFVIRHELYHLFRDGCKGFAPTIDYVVEKVREEERNPRIMDLVPFIKRKYLIEPRANIYALTGLKL